MYIYAQQDVIQSQPMYIRQSYGDRLQDELDYGVDGDSSRNMAQTKPELVSGNNVTENQTTENPKPVVVNIVDDKYFGMTKKQLALVVILGVVAGYFINRKIGKK